MWSRQEEKQGAAQERLEEEEEPAGVPGLDLRERLSVRFENKRMIKWLTPIKGLTWREKIINMLSSHRIQNIEYIYTLITLKRT